MNVKNTDILRKKIICHQNNHRPLWRWTQKEVGHRPLISDFVTLHCSTHFLFIMSALSATAVLQYTIVERLFWKMGLLCLPMKIVLQSVLCQPNSSTPTLIRLDWRLTKLLTTRWLLWWLFPLHWTRQCPFLRVDKPFVLMDFLPRHFFHKLFYLSSFSKFI